MSELELCPECDKKRENESGVKKKGEEDFWGKVKLALDRAEKCKYFCHHTLFDAEGKPEPDNMVGQRTCSLAIKAQCGHDVQKYGLCIDWRDGKECPDWISKDN